MKEFFYLLGNLIRWPVLETKDFLLLHAYISAIYLITFFLKNIGFNSYQFIFTLGILAPLLISIGKGLPLDCLDAKKLLKKELEIQ
tara:strand:+ start:18314 stop:18571 length:258 start_codon:yes stop_codon:yes gene_type:complete